MALFEDSPPLVASSHFVVDDDAVDLLQLLVLKGDGAALSMLVVNLPCRRVCLFLWLQLSFLSLRGIAGRGSAISHCVLVLA